MQSSLTEDEIVVALRDPERRRAAFAQIVDEYGEKLYWQIRKMVLAHEDANDLLQNTFLKAWTNLDYFRGEAKLSTWLYKIAVNECLTFLAKQRSQQQIAWRVTPISMGMPCSSSCKRPYSHCRRSNGWCST